MIVCLGDSITFGQHLDPLLAWPKLLDMDTTVMARGVPGDTTRLALERFPDDVQKLCPEKVIIQFGHNDANRWETDRGLPRVSLPAYKANLVEMVDRCRTFGAKPYLCTITQSLRSDQHRLDCERYNRTLLRVADEEDVPVVQVARIFEVAASKSSWSSLLMEDGLHLSEGGHRVYAEAVRTVIDIL